MSGIEVKNHHQPDETVSFDLDVVVEHPGRRRWVDLRFVEPNVVDGMPLEE